MKTAERYPMSISLILFGLVLSFLVIGLNDNAFVMFDKKLVVSPLVALPALLLLGLVTVFYERILAKNLLSLTASLILGLVVGTVGITIYHHIGLGLCMIVGAITTFLVRHFVHTGFAKTTR